MHKNICVLGFLSTLSLRRATADTQLQQAITAISIHALLAESDLLPARRGRGPGISIHALLAESDLRSCPASSPRRYFYPRSPCGERLTDVSYLSIDNSISIHALLAESDYWPRVIVSPTLYFYPRSPCGERHYICSNDPRQC